MECRIWAARLTNLPLPQNKLADMECRIWAARLTNWHAAKLKDEGHNFTKEAAMAKLMASEAATYCAHQVMDTFEYRVFVKFSPKTN